MTGIRMVGPINAADIAFLAKLSAGNELDSLHSINLHDVIIERPPDHAFEGLVFLTHFYFPTQLKAVGDFAFANCNALLNIELPQSLESIGEQAFANLHLRTLSLPAGVRHIEEALSNLAVVGRYILTPRIFSLLENLPRGAGNEIQLTDSIARLMDHEFVLAHAFDGKHYNCGSKLGYLEATVAYGLKHPETSAQFREL